MDDVIRDLDALIERFERELAPLTEPQLARKPGDGGWSAREVLGHVETTVRLYLERIEAVVARHPERRPPRTKPPRHGFVGTLLLRAMAKPGKRIRAPRVFRPPAGAQATAQELIAIHRRLRAAAETIRDRNLEARRIGTPVSPLLRMPVRAAIAVNVLHGERHLAQALRAAGGDGTSG